MTPNKEDYLKCIYELGQLDQKNYQQTHRREDGLLRTSRFRNAQKNGSRRAHF